MNTSTAKKDPGILERLQSLNPSNEASRRSLLIGVAVVLGLLFALRTGWGWYDSYRTHLEETIELKALQYEKLTRIAAGAKDYAELNKALQQFSQNLKMQRFIPGESQSLAEAQFQNIIKQTAVQNGINIRTMRTLPMTDKDGLKFTNISINARAEIGSIKKFLMAVRNHQKYIFCTEAEIKRISRREDRFFYFNCKLAALTQQ